MHYSDKICYHAYFCGLSCGMMFNPSTLRCELLGSSVMRESFGHSLKASFPMDFNDLGR